MLGQFRPRVRFIASVLWKLLCLAWRVSGDEFERRAWERELICIIPGRIGKRARETFYSTRLKNCGISPNFVYDLTVVFPEKVSFGDYISVNRHVFMNGQGGITIGNNVLIGPNVVIHSANHRFENPGLPINQQGHLMKPVAIEDNVWIGANVVVLPGVRIGTGSVVAAGAVVTRDLKPRAVYGGVPARLMKTLYDPEASLATDDTMVPTLVPEITKGTDN